MIQTWSSLWFKTISFILPVLMFDVGIILKGEVDASHSEEAKG